MNRGARTHASVEERNILPAFVFLRGFLVEGIASLARFTLLAPEPAVTSTGSERSLSQG